MKHGLQRSNEALEQGLNVFVLLVLSSLDIWSE